MASNLRAALGAAVRRLRRKAGLTIEELAFRCGVHPNYLGDIERGQRNPSLDNVGKIAAGLKVQVRELFPEGGGLPACEDPLEEFLRPLAGLVRDRPTRDRDCILDVARAVARRLKPQKGG
ncbi:MAG: helix-turn-helix transcriptional regulator [Elusimicrobia bacterium]|nr:helix-turn-helix transcriptional regulator [Elusimicrobiota bacterium]